MSGFLLMPWFSAWRGSYSRWIGTAVAAPAAVRSRRRGSARRVRVRAAEQWGEDCGENLRGGVRLQIEGAQVGEDVSDIGSREHAGSPAGGRGHDKSAPGGM